MKWKKRQRFALLVPHPFALNANRSAFFDGDTPLARSLLFHAFTVARSHNKESNNSANYIHQNHISQLAINYCCLDPICGSSRGIEEGIRSSSHNLGPPK